MRKVLLPELPHGWTSRTLSEVCEIVVDGTHQTPHYVRNGVRFISIANIRPFKPLDWDTYVRFITPEEHAELTKRCHPQVDDILFPRIGTLGFAKRIDFKEEVSIFVGLGLARPRKNIIDARYLEYYMNAPWIYRLAHERATGSGRLTLPLEEVRKFPVFFPSLDKQRTIVGWLDELFSDMDAGVAALERIRANLQRYRSSVLKAAVDGHLTADWRKRNPPIETGKKLLERILKERRARWEADQLAKFQRQGNTPPDAWQKKYVEPAGPDTTNSVELPQGWAWAAFSQLGSLDRGKSKHRPRNAPHLIGGPYPFIQTGDIRQANVYIREFNETYSEAGLAQSRLWPAGTLCITIAANIAESAILTFEACFPDSVVGFIPVLAELPVRFVQAYVRSVKKRLDALASATAQKNINLETLYGLPVPVPPEMELQEIIRELEEVESVIDACEVEIDHQLTKASNLRRGILKVAFSGKVLDESALNLTPAEAVV